MTVRIKSQARVKSQTLVNFPPAPALNLNFTKGYADGLNPLPSTVTFTRADASAIATQVGPDGFVRRAAHNIYTYSEQFDNAAWTNTGPTVTPNATTAPDGISTADLVVTSSGFLRQQPNVGSSVSTYTVSVYAKANASTAFSITEAGVTSSSASFTLSGAGIYTITNVGGNPSGSITYVGNGWYRCSFTYTTNGVQTILYMNLVATSAYLWGAQLEQNITPSYYVPTTSAAVYANTPRFDYDPVTTEPKGLLIEEARTNYCYATNALTNATYWSKGGTPTVTTSGVAPDGTSTAALITINANAFNWVFNAAGFSATAGTYTFSSYVKPGTSSYAILSIWAGSGQNGAFAWFNLSTGAAGTTAVTAGYSVVSSSITSVGNGWYRATITATVPTTTLYPALWPSNANGSYNSTINATSYWWGPQIEVGSFATSYIPNSGLSGTSVARAAESAAMTGANFSSWYTQGIGTFFLAADSFSTTVSDTLFVSTGGNFNPGSVGIYGPFNLGYTRASSAYTAQANASVTTSVNTLYKTAFGFKTDSVAICVNGGTVVSPASPNAMPTTVDTLNLMSLGVTGLKTNGHVAYLQYWPARFSNAQLQQITKAAPTLTVQGVTTLVGSTTVR